VRPAEGLLHPGHVEGVVHARHVAEDELVLAGPELAPELGAAAEHGQDAVADDGRDAHVGGQHGLIEAADGGDGGGLGQAHGRGLAEAALGDGEHVEVDAREAPLVEHARRLAAPVLAVEARQQRVEEGPVEVDLVLVAHEAEVVEQPEVARAAVVAVADAAGLGAPDGLPARHLAREAQVRGVLGVLARAVRAEAGGEHAATARDGRSACRARPPPACTCTGSRAR